MSNDDAPYAPAWSRYRRWSRAFWVGFVLYLPALAGVSRVLGSTATFVVGLAWLIGWAVIASRRWNFRCPRCGEPFFHKFDERPWRQDWRHNPFARRCLHCGLPKWATRDPG